MNILVIDVGGTHVKILVTGQCEPRKFDSGPTLNAQRMIPQKRIVEQFKEMEKSVAKRWKVLALSSDLLEAKAPQQPHIPLFKQYERNPR
jgi:hexokinase